MNRKDCEKVRQEISEHLEGLGQSTEALLLRQALTAFDYMDGRIESLSERIRKSTSFEPPSAEEVLAEFQEQGRPDLAEEFYNHFTTCDWRVGGKGKMKSLKASVRNWIIRDGKWSGKAYAAGGSSSGGGKVHPHRVTAERISASRRRAEEILNRLEGRS